MQILIFHIEKQKYALDLNCVERILLAVQYTPMPSNPEYVLGAINIHGDIIPVINTRKLLGLQPKEITPSDNYILCKIHHQRMALFVDHVEMVKICEEFTRCNTPTQCILKEEEEITLFCDLEKLVPECLLSVG